MASLMIGREDVGRVASKLRSKNGVKNVGRTTTPLYLKTMLLTS